MKDLYLSSCKRFRATLASKKRNELLKKKNWHIEYKVIRRQTEEGVGFIYNVMNKHGSVSWVFDPLLVPFNVTDLLDLAGLLGSIKNDHAENTEL